MPNDGTVVSNFEALGRVSTEAKLPVFASALDNASRGAVAATGIDYEQIGQRTAAIVLRILKGETVGSIPVDLPKSLDVVLNEKIAKEIGLALPSDLLQSAKLVIR